MFSGPFNRIIDAVANIAQKLGATVSSTGNRLADNLDGIANVVTPGGGGGSGVLVVSEDTTTGALDKTWREIREADFAVFAPPTGGMSGGKMFMPCIGALQVEDQHGEVTYNVYFLQTVPQAGDATCVVFEAVTDSEDGYPVPQTP